MGILITDTFQPSAGGFALLDLGDMWTKDATLKTLSSDTFTMDNDAHIVAAETGTTDDLDGIAGHGGKGRFLILRADTGDTITLKDENAGAAAADRIRTLGGSDQAVTEDEPAFLYYDVGLSRWLVLAGPTAAGGHAEDHAIRHSDGGADEVTVEDLATAGVVNSVPTSDGAGGLGMALIKHDNLFGVTAAQHHNQSHGSTDHSGKIGEVPWGPQRITLSKALPAATNNATLDDDWVYKSPWTNEAVRISRWYIRFESNLAAAATFELRKNGTLITGASFTVALGARDAAIDSFTETTLADGDSLEIWQTAGGAEDIGGSGYVYGDQDVVGVVTY